MANDWGTFTHYEGDEKEPYPIYNLKSSIVRKSMVGSTEKDPRSLNYRRTEIMKSAVKDDVIRRARTAILHEEEDDIHTTRAERIHKMQYFNRKVAPPPEPEPDYSDKREYFNMLQNSIEKKAT